MHVRPRWRQVSTPLLFALGLLSGAVALAYEVLWARELLNLLGSTTRASALVLAGFMAGLSLGAYVVGRYTVAFTRPLLLYAAAETALGGIGLLFPHSLQFLAARVGSDVLLDTLLFSLLAGPAFLMGAALPALAAALQLGGAAQPRHVAALYGLHTLGGATAAFGVGLAALPSLGLAASERTAAVAGLLLAAIAWILSTRALPASEMERKSASSPALDLLPGRPARAAVLTTLVLGGVAALGYEVLWTRTLVLVVGSSTTAFALMLGLYLLGLAVGGGAMSLFPGWEVKPARTLQALLLAVGATVLIGAGGVGWLPSAALFGFARLGTAPWSILVVDVVLIAAIILPPTVLIGASFPVAARLMEGDAPRRGREVGVALALTSAGNVLGILLTAFALIPLVGLQGGVAVLAVLNALAALLLWFVIPRRPMRLRYAVPAVALAVVLAAGALPAWDIAVMTSGVFRQAPVYLALLGSAGRLERAFSAYETRYYREGSEAVVAVFDRPTLKGEPHRVLTIDGKVDASTGADMATQVLSGHLPFVFRPKAKRALVIGLASGVTVGALANHPLDRIEVVEIEPAVVEASRAFDGLSGAPLDDPRVHLTVADGRRYLSRVRATYDIVVSEPSNPWLSMSARLFTREFFALVRERLSPQGVLVQWIPLYGLSPAQFRTLLRTILDVFPELALFRVAEGDLVAVASRRPLALEPQGLSRLFETKAARQLRAVGIREPSQLLAQWAANAEGLRTAIDRGPLNTDDNGLLEFGSPWYLLSETKPENENLVSQASRSSRVPEQIVRQWLALKGSMAQLDALANTYLARGRIDSVRGLAQALRSIGHVARADLHDGDALAAEGRWTEAKSLWARHDRPAFWLRRARAAFRTGSADTAAHLFAKVPAGERSAEDNISYALVLAGSGDRREALQLLEATKFSWNTAAGALAPFVRYALLTEGGETEKGRAELGHLEQVLDGLRRCLEADGCKETLDRLVWWSKAGVSRLEPHYVAVLKQAIFLRITRPLPHYFEAVRNLWLGNAEGAKRAFRTYLGLLPEPDPHSRAHRLVRSKGSGDR